MEVDFSLRIKELFDNSEAKRSGPKSSAQTPAPKSDQKTGSDKNKKGSAGTDGGKIEFSEKIINSLQEKVTSHNEKYDKKVSLSQLKKVYRRGLGAFSSSHRPGQTRGSWAMARVNMFLKMIRGGKVKILTALLIKMLLLALSCIMSKNQKMFFGNLILLILI